MSFLAIPRTRFCGLPIRHRSHKPWQIATPLKWYEYGWAALPMVLLFMGGALGGLTGTLGSYCNFRILRSDRGGLAKIALSTATTLIAAVAFFVLAVSFRMAVGR